MKKRITTLIAVLALVSLSAMAFAAAPKAAKAEADGLTAEKRATIQKIIEAHQDKLYELREKIWAKHTELQALSASGKADKADIQNLVGEISKLREAMHQERQAIRSEIESKTGLKGYGPRGYHRGMGYGGGYGGYGGYGEGCPGGGGYGKGFRGAGTCPGGACN